MHRLLLTIVILINTATADTLKNDTVDIVPNVELFPTLPLGIPNSQNEQCKHDSLLYFKNIVNSTTWAYQMWDSSAKQPNGQLYSVGYNLGHYQECLAVREPFKTQYCLVFVEAHTTPTKDLGTDPFYRDPFDVVTNALHHKGGNLIFHHDQSQLGLCVPASCDYQEFQEYLNSYLAKKVTEGTLNISYSVKIPTGCQTNRDDERLGPDGIAFICTVACLVFLVIICSLIDWRQQETKSTNNSGYFSWLIDAFSLRNTHVVLMENSEEHSELRSLHGFRFLCIVLTILGHASGICFAGPLHSVQYVEKFQASLMGRTIFHAQMVVDAFLVLSGTLLMYTSLRQNEKRHVHPISLIVLRYIRLTPLYALMVWYYCSVFYLTGDGPLWKLSLENEIDLCRKNWWLNFLYINNEVLTHSMCLIHSWYMSCDTQLFIVGAFVCTLVHKRTKFGLFVIVVLILITIPISFGISYYNDLDGIVKFSKHFVENPREDTLFRTLYIKSYTRGGAFFIGMLTGYQIFKWKKNGKAQLPTVSPSEMKTVFQYAFLTVIMSFINLVLVHFIYDLSYPYNVIFGSLLASVDRLIWCVGLAIFILLLGFGYLPIISTFLNWSIFVPLGKLSLGVYLFHFLFIQHFTASLQTAIQYNFYEMCSLVSTILIWNFTIALIVYYTIDAPLKILVTKLMKPKTRHSENKTKFPNVVEQIDLEKYHKTT